MPEWKREDFKKTEQIPGTEPEPVIEGTEETDELEEDDAETANLDETNVETKSKALESDTKPEESVTEAPAGEPVELDANFQLTPPQKPEIPKELKIMITLDGDSFVVGIRKEGCDPVFFHRPDGGLDKAIESLKVNIQFANNVWDKSPRYPKVVIPTPPAPAAPAPAPARPSVPVNTGSVVRPPPPPKPKIQPSMF